MADVHKKATRSYNISRILGKNTKPELKISGAKYRCNRWQRHHMFLETPPSTYYFISVSIIETKTRRIGINNCK